MAGWGSSRLPDVRGVRGCLRGKRGLREMEKMVVGGGVEECADLLSSFSRAPSQIGDDAEC